MGRKVGKPLYKLNILQELQICHGVYRWNLGLWALLWWCSCTLLVFDNENRESHYY